jgi:putative DNA primase/helicase
MTRKAQVVDLFTNTTNPVALQAAHWRTTDIANARAFIDAHGNDWRHAHNGGGWHEWDDGRWRRDATQSICARAQDAISQWWTEVGVAGSPEERELLAKHFLASGKVPRLQAMLTLAATDRRVALPADAFDRDPWLLNVANGTIDLRTGTLRPHRRADLISKRAPIAYHPTAQCPQFYEFLQLIFEGQQELIDFIQRAFGYSATGLVRDQCVFFCWGSGANGKSTLLSIIHAVLGEYGRTAAPSLLMATKHDAHPTEIADLLGARLVSAIETEQDRRLAEVKVKWLTGGDRLKGRFMRQDFFEFDATHKFWLAGNHKPVVTGTDPAIWRRIHLIPFVVNLKETLQDNLVSDFAATLTDEFPGILAWIVEGALAWHTDGLKPPSIVSAATAAYRQEMDAVGQWIEECCERAANARTPFKLLYNAYAEDLKADAFSKRAFAQELDRLGIHSHVVGGVKFRAGVRLRDDQQSRDDH